MDRKNSHIQICLEEEVEFAPGEANGFASYRFDHDALPEIDAANISIETEILGKRLAAPLIVGAMTGGTERAGEINRRLARAAARCRVGMALGSQRKMLTDPSTRGSYAVREFAPDLPLLIGNIGAIQLNYGVRAPELQGLVKDVGCDAFTFHLNPLQEFIQPEGDRDFSTLIFKLAAVIPQLNVPVLVKEVGSGISETTAMKLKALPIAGVETAGVGGTSWARVEGLRATEPVKKALGEIFAGWGIPTAESVAICRRVLPELTVIASGGIRNGIEAAKAIALGADAVALALPFLKAAEQSEEAAVEAIQQKIEELKATMFVTASISLEELRKRPLRRVHDFTAR